MRLNREAPSTFAASCKAGSTPESAARYIIADQPKSCQLPENMNSGRKASASRKSCKPFTSPPSLMLSWSKRPSEPKISSSMPTITTREMKWGA